MCTTKSKVIRPIKNLRRKTTIGDDKIVGGYYYVSKLIKIQDQICLPSEWP